MNDDYTARMRYLGLYFWEKEVNWIPCGQCPIGQLKIEEIRHFQSRESKALMEVDGGYPEDVRGIFNGELRCSNCDEISVFDGLYDMDITFGIDGQPAGWGNRVLIKNIFPAVPLIRFPRRCPTIIRDRLTEASSVIWRSPDLAASRIRTATDDLLTLQKVKKTVVNKKSKRVKLSTHERIVQYSKTNPDEAKALEAVKWLGNDGTHEASLTINDVFDGLDLFSYALNSLYANDSKVVNKLASKIIARKGASKRK